MRNLEIKFKSKTQNYSVIIGKNAINSLPKRIKSLCPEAKNIAFIVDKNVPVKFIKNFRNSLKGYNLTFLKFIASEKNKSLKFVNYF